MNAIAFDHKLTVAVPAVFQRALGNAARLRGLSLPDLIRRELQAALVRAISRTASSLRVASFALSWRPALRRRASCRLGPS